MIRSAIRLSLLSLVALCVGCGDSGPKLYKVKGTLTYKGKPVPYVLLTFTPDDEKTKAPAMSGTDEKGRIEMKIGPSQVCFRAPQNYLHGPTVDHGWARAVPILITSQLLPNTLQANPF